MLDFNALRYLVKTGAPWRYLPDSFPPWPAVYQQTQRCLTNASVRGIIAGCFVAMAHDLRAILRLAEGRKARPTAAIYDAQTLAGTIESRHRAGYDGHKKKNGSKSVTASCDIVHAAVDTLGHLRALTVTPASEQDRDHVAELSRQLQEATDESVEIAFADQGYTGEQAEAAAKEHSHIEDVGREHGIELQIVKRPEAKKGFVLLPRRRWIVERSFSWKSRFRRLVCDYERLLGTVAGLHFLAFVCLMLASLFA